MLKKGFSIVALVVAVVIIVGGVLVWQLWPKSQSSAEEAVKNVVTKFLQAEQTRNFENAKPFLSSEFAKTIDSITFAGTSNPHMSRFEIGKVQLLPDGKTYQVNAKVYQEYTGEGDIGYNENNYYVELFNDHYLINNIEYGKYIELSENETADWKTYCINGTNITFDIPAEFQLGPSYNEYVKNECFDFSNFGYPMAGFTYLGVFGNYKYPTLNDSDKIIREKTKDAIEISVGGLNYPWDKYFYRNDYKKIINNVGLSFYERTPLMIGDRWSAEIAVEIQPSENNANTHIIWLNIRTADPEQFSNLKSIFESLKEKIIIGNIKAKNIENQMNWKTYTNEKYGFEIRYPKEWTMDDETMIGTYKQLFVVFKNPNDPLGKKGFDIRVSPLSSARKDFPCSDVGENISVLGQQYLTCLFPEFGGVELNNFFIPIPKNDFEYGLYVYDKKVENSIKTIILSTFRFLK